MTAALPLRYERSARTDIRILGMLVVGAIFAWAGSIVDPATNCDEAGDCAPWLVPVAKWMGFAFAASAGALLWVNPRRGHCIDPSTGDLIWWQRRVGRHEGDMGRIHPSRIGVIHIVRRSDNGDEVHLYDRDGVRQAYFDGEVIPWPYERWAERFTEGWPEIEMRVVD